MAVTSTGGTILGIIAILLIGGGVALFMGSTRVRAEIDALRASFDRSQRCLIPLVETLATDRDRLSARLAELTEPGAETRGTRR